MVDQKSEISHKFLELCTKVPLDIFKAIISCFNVDDYTIVGFQM